MRILILHGSYGCDTGCCGHFFEVDGEEVSGTFDFMHPYGENFRAWAEEKVTEQFGAEHVKDLDWENSIVSDD